jgi:hypothetical protein
LAARRNNGESVSTAIAAAVGRALRMPAQAWNQFARPAFRAGAAKQAPFAQIDRRASSARRYR